ncbi:hypothetical protein LINGRAHAP2_LOCUS23635 [Linum grandiflorum]
MEGKKSMAEDAELPPSPVASQSVEGINGLSVVASCSSKKPLGAKRTSNSGGRLGARKLITKLQLDETVSDQNPEEAPLRVIDTNQQAPLRVIDTNQQALGKKIDVGVKETYEARMRYATAKAISSAQFFEDRHILQVKKVGMIMDAYVDNLSRPAKSEFAMKLAKIQESFRRLGV